MVLKLEQLSSISSGAKNEPKLIFDIRQRGKQWCIFINGDLMPNQCFSSLKDAVFVAQMLAYGSKQMVQGYSMEDALAKVAGIVLGMTVPSQKK